MDRVLTLILLLVMLGVVAFAIVIGIKLTQDHITQLVLIFAMATGVVAVVGSATFAGLMALGLLTRIKKAMGGDRAGGRYSEYLPNAPYIDALPGEGYNGLETAPAIDGRLLTAPPQQYMLEGAGSDVVYDQRATAPWQ